MNIMEFQKGEGCAAAWWDFLLEELGMEPTPSCGAINKKCKGCPFSDDITEDL